eukprot:COSAG02_NODE_29768_length_563_cov_1.103448_1_plen_20_part_01
MNTARNEHGSARSQDMVEDA